MMNDAKINSLLGLLGTAGTVALSNLNLTVSIIVGVLTGVYMAIQIARAVRDWNKPRE